MFRSALGARSSLASGLAVGADSGLPAQGEVDSNKDSVVEREVAKMSKTGIEWTDATWNPVTGCDQISPGCDNCYALSMAKRLKAMGVEQYQNEGNPITSGPGFAVTYHPRLLDVPRRWKAPRMVFVNSMSDLFHAKVPLHFIQDVFDVMRGTPQHTYQVLTKRATRARKLAPKLDWPPNLWMGVSVETQEQFHRIEELRGIPANVRFLSCEPLLGSMTGINLTDIDWVIAGGESGRNYRPMDIAWARSIRDEATKQNVSFFFKQWGGVHPKKLGRELDGIVWDEMPAARIS